MQDAITKALPGVSRRSRIATPDTTEFAPDTVLGGSYRLIRALGGGGMGDIHLASHERLPGRLVVKVLSRDLSDNENAIVRFRQEAMVMANIRHPNVVQLVDFNLTPTGRPYLVMEYLPGQNLAEVLAAGPLSAPEVSIVVRQVACALDAAHRLGIVHRDLKPENIMLVPCEGQGDLVKVIDFGISKARRLNQVTGNCIMIGTPEFMSPEQAQGRQEEVNAPSDQFALAVISYLLLTGRMPWRGTSPNEILQSVVHRLPAPMTDDGSWRSIEAVVFRGMAKAGGDRYPSVLAFWRALDQAMIDDGLLLALSSPASARAASAAQLEKQRIPLAEPDPVPARRRQPAKGLAKGLMWAAGLLAVLGFGGYLGLQAFPATRDRAEVRWNEFSNLAARPVERVLAEAHHLIVRPPGVAGQLEAQGR